MTRPVTSMAFCQPTAIFRSRTTGSLPYHGTGLLTLRSPSRLSPGTPTLVAVLSVMSVPHSRIDERADHVNDEVDHGDDDGD